MGDGDARREERLRRELRRWRGERIVAVVLVVWATTLGGLALTGRVPALTAVASAIWWLFAPAVVALLLGLRALVSPLGRRTWPAGQRSLVPYSRGKAVQRMLAGGDPVPAKDRGIAVEMLLSNLEVVRGVSWVMLAQGGVHGAQVDPSFPHRLDVIRLIIATGTLTLGVGGFGYAEREARRAARFLAHGTDAAA